MVETFQAGGKNIRIDVHGAGASAPGAPLKPAILLIHGSGGNIGFWLDRLTPHLAAAGVALFAPHYFERTGTIRADLATITDGIHVPQWLDTIAAAREAVAARPGIDPNRIALIGISLGAFLSMAYAAINSASTDPAAHKAIRCIVELSGGLTEPYASQATPQLPPTLILHGADDNIVPVSSAHELDALLTNLGVQHETRVLQREGHWFSGPAQMQLLLAVRSFLSKHLQQNDEPLQTFPTK